MKCPSGKVCLNSKKQAEQKMHAYWRTKRPGPVPVRVYHCPLCNQWHMTSKPKRESQRKVS